MSRNPTRFQQRTIWNALTGLSIAVIGALLCGLIYLVGQILGFLQPVLVPVAVAMIIAYLLEPVVHWLVKRGFSRLWAVITLFLGLLLLMSILIASVLPGIQQGSQMLGGLIPPQFKKETKVEPVTPDEEGKKEKKEKKPDDTDTRLANQLGTFLLELHKKNDGNPIGWALTETHPKVQATTRKGDSITLEVPEGEVEDAAVATPVVPTKLDFFWKTRVGRALVESKTEIMDTGKRWLSVGTNKVLSLLGLLLGLLIAPVYLFFFLKDSDSIRKRWHNYVPLRASHFKTEVVETLQEINGYLISFFRGQVVVAMIDGILVGITLSIYGLPYGFLVGIFMAILGIIPYIGNIMCLIPACIIAFLHAKSAGQGEIIFGLSPVMYTIGVVVIFVVVQQINSLVTAPKIVGDSVGLHPMTVIFSMLFWTLILGGFLGALLAVPLTAALKVLLRRYFWERGLKEDIQEAEQSGDLGGNATA